MALKKKLVNWQEPNPDMLNEAVENNTPLEDVPLAQAHGYLQFWGHDTVMLEDGNLHTRTFIFVERMDDGRIMKLLPEMVTIEAEV